jgi:large subunit ribosomal protein L32
MAVPKKKTSRSVRDMRRSHHAIQFTGSVDYCANCGEPKLRHRMCVACGTWKGRQIGKDKIGASQATDGGAPSAE